jgi:hypothetical protein
VEFGSPIPPQDAAEPDAVDRMMERIESELRALSRPGDGP